jgi:hypothetical protein
LVHSLPNNKPLTQAQDAQLLSHICSAYSTGRFTDCSRTRAWCWSGKDLSKTLLGLTIQNRHGSNYNIDIIRRSIMRCYRHLTFASGVVATLSAPDVASPRSNGGPSLVRRAELAYASPYIYIGCYSDSYSNRALSVGNPTSETLVIEECAATCAQSNYTYMGVEYMEEVSYENFC